MLITGADGVLLCVAVLDHRKKCGVPYTPIAREAINSKPEDSFDVSCDSNSFTAIMSEGESSSEGEAEEEDKDTHGQARERFIQEAKERRSFDQHSTSDIHQMCVEISQLLLWT